MYQSITSPVNQETSKNPKKVWMDPELVNINVNGGANAFTSEDPIFYVSS
jgi:hypothetical protein